MPLARNRLPPLLQVTLNLLLVFLPIQSFLVLPSVQGTTIGNMIAFFSVAPCLLYDADSRRRAPRGLTPDHAHE
jgi:hypothetical protein